MLRNKLTKELEEAHCYFQTTFMFDDDELDVLRIQYLKSRLKKVWSRCNRAVNYGNGKIKELRSGPSGFFEWFDAADARLVARYIKRRLTEINRIIVETPAKPLLRLHDDAHLHTHPTERLGKHMQYVQRAVKRKQRIKAQRSSHGNIIKQALPEYDELLELELAHKERVPHRKGHGKCWIPTRQRYWSPDNNNWKQHGQRSKQWELK